jgi:nitrate/nitrite transporter NarK
MTNVAWVFLATWLPRYLDEVHEVEPTVRGWMAGTPIIIGWFGMLLGGWLTDRLVRVFGLRWGRGLPMSVSRFVAMAAYLICLLQPSPWIATAAFALVAFATDIGIGATWAFLQDVGGRHVGSVLGWTNMWGNFGAALSPWLLNWMIGDSRNWDAAFLTCAGAFLLSGLAALGVDARQRV